MVFKCPLFYVVCGSYGLSANWLGEQGFRPILALSYLQNFGHVCPLVTYSSVGRKGKRKKKKDITIDLLGKTVVSRKGVALGPQARSRIGRR